MERSYGGEQAPGDATAAAAGSIGAAGDVVRIAARAFERDRYLTALLAPPEVRDDLIALAAFAGEVGRIPATISEPMIGAIRLQWWRDTVEAAGRTPALRSGHPIADALAAAIVKHRLPLGLVIGIIDAQEAGLGTDPPADDLALGQHLAKTEGAQFELALRVLGGEQTTEVWRPMLPAATMAYGLTRLLVELPALGAEGRTLVPAARLADAGLTLDALSARTDDASIRIKPVIDRLAADARRHLAIAAGMLHERRRSGERIAMLPLSTVAPTLRAVLRAAAQPLSHGADILPLTRVLRLAWTYATGRL